MVSQNHESGLPADHAHAESWSDPIRMRDAIGLAESIVREDPGRSLELAGEGLRIARSLQEPHVIALALRIIGTALIVTGNYRGAIDRLKEGLREREKADNPKEWIDLHYLIGAAATHLGDYEAGADHCSTGLKRAEEIGWEEGRCRGLNNLGLIAFRTNRYDDALIFLEQSHAIGRRIGDREAEGKAIRNIGSVREHQGEIAQAITCYSQALEIFIEIDLTPELPGLYNDLAGVWCIVGEFPRAFDAYRNALEQFQTFGNAKGIAFVLNNLGHLYLDLGQDDQALEHFRDSLRLKEEIGIDRILISTLRNIAGILGRQGQFDAARAELKRCDALCERISDDFLTAQIAFSWGVYHEQKGEIAQAITSFTRALELFDSIGASDRGASIRLQLGRLARQAALLHGDDPEEEEENRSSRATKEEEYGRAIELLQSALQIGIELDLKEIRFEAHEELSNVLQDIGEFREALEHYRQSRELRHAFSSAESEERLRHLMILYNLDRERQGRKIAEQQSEIHRLETERLAQDVEHRTRELAATGMYLARKNDLLQKIRGELDRFREDPRSDREKVLGKLISAIDQEVHAEGSWGTFEEQFRLLHPTFIEQLSRSYPDLSPVESKVCALIKAGLSIKETAQILNIESRSVETYRGRIRSKLHLERGDNLAAFLSRIG